MIVEETPAARASATSSAAVSQASAVLIPWLRWQKVSVATTTTSISSTFLARARSSPRRFMTSPAYLTPSCRGSAVISSSASAICGTRAGFTKLVTSMRRAPARTALSTSSTLSSVARIVFSFCSPSRGETSRISISAFTAPPPGRPRPSSRRPLRRTSPGGRTGSHHVSATSGRRPRLAPRAG